MMMNTMINMINMLNISGISDKISNSSAILMALVATLGTWFLTALGAFTVVFFKRIDRTVINLMLGFSAGVMIASSFWSLLLPSLERSREISQGLSWLVVTGGFLLGSLFMLASDTVIYKLQKNSLSMRRSSRVLMTVISITLHNIPEGLAVGVAFGLLKNGFTDEGFMGAFMMALGIGLQNFPEGAAVSLPMRAAGYSRKKSFFYGQASGIVEPLAGVMGALLVVYIVELLPIALSFAAGAMIFVAVHELIPEGGNESASERRISTLGCITGFSVMTLLDIALG